VLRDHHDSFNNTFRRIFDSIVAFHARLRYFYIEVKKNGPSIKHESMEQNESGHLDLKEHICFFFPRFAEYESLEPSLKLKYLHFSEAGGCLMFVMRRI
jgi:hypothetical protein